MLTVKELENRARRDGTHSVGDGSGLALLVRESGKYRRWVQRITIGGKRRDIGHGNYPAVSLAKARAAAKAIQDDVAAGRDPLAERREVSRENTAATARTFDAAISGYIEAHGAAWRSEKTRKFARLNLERHAKALLGKAVRDVSTNDVLHVLRPIWTMKPVMAGHVRARIEAVLDWAKGAGWRSGENPAAWRGVLKPLLAKPSSVIRNRHHPALAWEQLPAFLAELRDENGNAARCLELCILTACRSGEARGAAWREIDMAAATWTVPAKRMKAGEEHRIPLSVAALTLLRSMQCSHGGKPDPDALIFPNRDGNAYSDMSILAVLKRMDAARQQAEGRGWRNALGERITPHGFRSTFRDWCGDHGQPRELAEAALAHTLGSRTERAYARTDLFARRARLMNAWSAYCEGRAASADDVGDAALLRAVSAA